MSKTMHAICHAAQAVGMEPDAYLDAQAARRRDEEAFGAYWKDSELCSACGWQGVPERVRAGTECIDFCPACGQAETFHMEATDDEA